ncbi:MAG: ribosome maturation factor RimP [Acidobacteria bacterium]|nr:MAG: ribosome maturation factor RimP [Acidobacteriota bacterium]
MAILDRVVEMAEDIAASEGLELVHAEFVPEGKKWFLRLYIDREGGVTISDCTKLSRQLAVELEVEDVIPHSYTLEVSSPGIDRVMGKLHDYEKFAGENIKIKLRRAVNGHRKVKGLLKGLDSSGSQVIVECDGETVKLPFSDIARANLVREIDL